MASKFIPTSLLILVLISLLFIGESYGIDANVENLNEVGHRKMLSGLQGEKTILQVDQQIYVISFNSTHGFGVLFFTLVSLALLFWSTHLMHDHICSNNTLKGELLEVRVSEKRLLDKIQDLKVDYVKLIGDVLEKVVKQQVSEIMNLEIRLRMPCWQENYWLRRS
ncbi:kinesin protein KIN-12D [Trifolium repens]|nr:kinesin protein KIN-12D [Trifolium repens]